MESEEYNKKVKLGIRFKNFNLGYDGPGKILPGILITIIFGIYCFKNNVFEFSKLLFVILSLAFITGFVIVQKKF